MGVYFGSISSLMQISLNIIDILCLHIIFWIRSNSRITFIVFGGWGLIYVLSIVTCITSTFCPTLGHHRGRIYYKSDVTSVFASVVFVHYSDVLILLCCRCEFSVIVLLGMNVFLNAELLNLYQ